MRQFLGVKLYKTEVQFQIKGKMEISKKFKKRIKLPLFVKVRQTIVILCGIL